MKPAWKTKTFWAATLTVLVTGLKEVSPPEYAPYFAVVQGVLVSAGLWFARSGGVKAAKTVAADVQAGNTPDPTEIR